VEVARLMSCAVTALLALNLGGVRVGRLVCFGGFQTFCNPFILLDKNHTEFGFYWYLFPLN
jgi:hypothetical protein